MAFNYPIKHNAHVNTYRNTRSINKLGVCRICGAKAIIHYTTICKRCCIDLDLPVEHVVFEAQEHLQRLALITPYASELFYLTEDACLKRTMFFYYCDTH